MTNADDAAKTMSNFNPAAQKRDMASIFGEPPKQDAKKLDEMRAKEAALEKVAENQKRQEEQKQAFSKIQTAEFDF